MKTHVRSLWLRYKDSQQLDWVLDNTLLCGLGLGLRETLQYLNTHPTLEEFENWVDQTNGGRIDERRIDAALSDDVEGARLHFPAGPPPLSENDLAFWDEHGYVVVHNAVSMDNCRAAARAIYDFLEMDLNDPQTWYGGPQGHSIWIPLLRHPAFLANRNSARIHRAFAQLWGREDLWMNVDQGGMNPPERPGWKFPGPHLHWDMSLALPIHFGVQGILYLTDTAADQGAFTCVPGFHRKIEAWLAALPEDADARKEALNTLTPVPIAGQAGDLIIWHHALPHGSSPNRARVPRVVQYMMMRPSRWEFNPVWR